MELWQIILAFLTLVGGGGAGGFLANWIAYRRDQSQLQLERERLAQEAADKAKTALEDSYRALLDRLERRNITLTDEVSRQHEQIEVNQAELIEMRGQLQEAILSLARHRAELEEAKRKIQRLLSENGQLKASNKALQLQLDRLMNGKDWRGE